MSYNGIGLPSARGSGTNGFIQKNLAARHSNSQASKYNSYTNKYEARKQLKLKNEKNEEKFQRRLNFKSDIQIVEHERKRLVELRCCELRDELEEVSEKAEEEGKTNDVLTEDQIEMKVDELRKSLLRKLETDPDFLVRSTRAVSNSKLVGKNSISKAVIRKNNFDLHTMARQKEIENEKFATAFRLSERVTPISDNDHQYYESNKTNEQKDHQYYEENETNDQKDHQEKDFGDKSGKDKPVYQRLRTKNRQSVDKEAKEFLENIMY